MMNRVVFFLICCWAVVGRDDVFAAGTDASSKPLPYALVVTGGELLEGAYADAHTHYITRTLRPLGMQCVVSMTVDDERESMIRAFHYATNAASLIFVTGGLGPTPNDITREALSEFTGIPLREDPVALLEMERRFQQSRDQLRPNLRKQTMVPAGGKFLRNPHGTAVGLLFELEDKLILALPGPPRELQTMISEEVVPLLQSRFGRRVLGPRLAVRFVGLGQSAIDQGIKEHVPLPDGTIETSLFQGGRVDFMFTLPDRLGAKEELEQLEKRIRAQFPENIYGTGNIALEEVILGQLKGGHLVLVEMATGGRLVSGFTGVDKEGQVAAGYVFSDWNHASALLGAKQAEDLKTQTKALSEAAARKHPGDWVIAVSALDRENGTVSLGLRRPDGTMKAQQYSFRGSGDADLTILASQMAAQVWRWIEEKG